MPPETNYFGGNPQAWPQNSCSTGDFWTGELVEETLETALPTGQGHTTHWQFEGIRMSYSRWHSPEPFAVEWRADPEAVYLRFNLRGRTALENHGTSAATRLASAQHSLAYYQNFDGLIHYEDLESETFLLQFAKPIFLALAQPANEALGHFCATVLRGDESVLSPQALSLSLGLHSAIREVLRCQLPGPLKKLFLYAKAIEILVLQADALARQVPAGRRHIRTDYDRERLLFARDYLLQHTALPPSLPELARLAGVNEFKLKNGFKELFGHTVFGYLREHRLADAKAQLQERRKTASELAFELGYASVQHFSTAFKAKFGVSPTELRG